MLIGQRLHEGFVIDERGHRYSVPFYLDDVLNVSKAAEDDGKVHFYANLRGVAGRKPITVEIESHTMRDIQFARITQ